MYKTNIGLKHVSALLIQYLKQSYFLFRDAELSNILTKSVSINLFFGFLINSVIFIIRKFIKKNKGGSIIVVSLHKLGDTVYTIPAIRNIKSKYPNLIILCFKESEPIYRIVFDNIKFILLDRNDFCIGGRITKGKARKKLRKQIPEIIYDLTGVMTSATLIFNSSANSIIGFNRKYFKSIYSTFYEINQLFESISDSYDIYNQAIKQNIFIANKKNMIINSYDPTSPLLIHPFSGWRSKEWGIKNFIDLSRELSKNYLCFFVVPSNSLTKEIEEAIESVGTGILYTRSIEELIKNLNNSSILISNDSGPIQIASLLGKPTYSIYGPTNPKFNIPIGANYRFIQKQIKCSPKVFERMCFAYGGKNCPAHNCLDLLTVNDVYSNLKLYLDELLIKQKFIYER